MNSGWLIHTSDGSVDARLPEDLAAELYAHTGDGHIQFDMPVTVSGAIEHTRVRGKLNGGGSAAGDHAPATAAYGSRSTNAAGTVPSVRLFDSGSPKQGEPSPRMTIARRLTDFRPLRPNSSTLQV